MTDPRDPYGGSPVNPPEHRQEEILERDAARLAEERPDDEGVPFADLVVEHMRDPEYRREFIASAERRGTVTWLRSPEALQVAEQHFPAPWSKLLCKCGSEFGESFQAHWLEELAKARAAES